jgi:GntR family transcriptional regulator
MDININSSQPIYKQIADHFRLQINEGKLLPEDSLPSETEIAKIYSISRMTARKAVDILVNEGLVKRIVGKGTFVENSKVSFSPSTLFSFSKNMNILGYKTSTQILEQKIENATSKIANALEIELDDPVVYIKRLRFADEEPVSIDMTYLPAKIFKQLADADLNVKPITEMMEDILRLKIGNSVDYAEAVICSKEESRILRVPEGTPLLLISGISYDEKMRPQRFAKALYRSDRFRFKVGTEIKPK